MWMPHDGSVYGRRLGRVNRRIPLSGHAHRSHRAAQP
jgi:hypothetical protein